MNYLLIHEELRIVDDKSLRFATYTNCQLLYDSSNTWFALTGEDYIKFNTVLSGTTYTRKTLEMVCSVPAATSTQPRIAGGNANILDWTNMSGVNHTGAQIGYWLFDASTDNTVIGFTLPDLFIDTGVQNAIKFEFECIRAGLSDADVRVSVFVADNTTPFIASDSFTATSSKSWVDLNTNATGIGNQASLAQGQGYIMTITGDATNDSARVFRIHIIYITGIENDAS